MAAADFALAAREADGLTGARHGRHLIERSAGIIDRVHSARRSIERARGAPRVRRRYDGDAQRDGIRARPHAVRHAACARSACAWSFPAYARRCSTMRATSRRRRIIETHRNSRSIERHVRVVARPVAEERPSPQVQERAGQTGAAAAAAAQPAASRGASAPRSIWPRRMRCATAPSAPSASARSAKPSSARARRRSAGSG